MLLPVLAITFVQRFIVSEIGIRGGKQISAFMISGKKDE
jgi:hypothetical protein